MKVHPPRAIDSWREFLIEIVIIVIGVALALAAEEAISNYHTSQEVAVVQDSLDDELADSLFASLERLKQAQCRDRALGRLDAIANGADGSSLAGVVPASPMRLWASAAWDAAVASGIVEEMEHDERHSYAVLFSIVRNLHEWNARERELWATVRAYERTAPATAESRHRLAETVSQLRSLEGVMTAAARRFAQAARPLRLKLAPADLVELREPAPCPLA